MSRLCARGCSVSAGVSIRHHLPYDFECGCDGLSGARFGGGVADFLAFFEPAAGFRLFFIRLISLS
jgi:hypothetical protein